MRSRNSRMVNEWPHILTLNYMSALLSVGRSSDPSVEEELRRWLD